MFERLIYQWIQKDSAGTLEYVQTVPVGVGKEKLLQFAINSLAYQDPGTAAQLAASLSAGSAQQNAWSRIASGYANTGDTTAALEWIATLPEGSAKNNAWQSVAAPLAQKDPKAAAEFALTIPAGGGRDSFIGSIVNSWAQNDAAGAATWIQSLPEGQARQNALAA